MLSHEQAKAALHEAEVAWLEASSALQWEKAMIALGKASVAWQEAQEAKVAKERVAWKEEVRDDQAS